MKMPDPSEIFRSGVTLLAFVMAFYALMAKERKTPYMVHSVYSLSYWILFSLALATLAMVVSDKFNGYILGPACAILICSLFFVIFRLKQEHNRHIYFRDDRLIKNLAPFRWIKNVESYFKRKDSYEHTTIPLPASLIESLKNSKHLPKEQLESAFKHHTHAPQLSIAAAMECNSLIEIDDVLTDTAIKFLDADCFVQYTCCSRYPSEWLSQLKNRWQDCHKGENWKYVAEKVVIVDGYSSHFGFTDSIYEKHRRAAQNDCMEIVKYRKTYAGVHTAIAKAFNEIKKRDKKNVRTPTLIIYEGCGSLADLESQEQYRIFLKHVIPSERLWGGMFTIFAESALTKESAELLRSLSHIYIEKPPIDLPEISHE